MIFLPFAFGAHAAPTVQQVREHWHVRTDLELDTELRRVCEAARVDRKPVLLELSAPWCGDCRRLLELTQQEPLAAELDAWHHVVIDVGRFEHHDALREAFAVPAIAYLVALGGPESCAAPVTVWRRLDARLLEPATGQPVTASDVSDWLGSLRACSRTGVACTVEAEVDGDGAMDRASFVLAGDRVGLALQLGSGARVVLGVPGGEPVTLDVDGTREPWTSDFSFVLDWRASEGGLFLSGSDAAAVLRRGPQGWTLTHLGF